MTDRQPFTCVECGAPADASLICPQRDDEHAYLRASNDNQGHADEIEGGCA